MKNEKCIRTYCEETEPKWRDDRESTSAEIGLNQLFLMCTAQTEPSGEASLQVSWLLCWNKKSDGFKFKDIAKLYQTEGPNFTKWVNVHKHPCSKASQKVLERLWAVLKDLKVFFFVAAEYGGQALHAFEGWWQPAALKPQGSGPRQRDLIWRPAPWKSDIGTSLLQQKMMNSSLWLHGWLQWSKQRLDGFCVGRQAPLHSKGNMWRFLSDAADWTHRPAGQ